MSTGLHDQTPAVRAVPDPFVERVRRLFRRARKQPRASREAWIDAHATTPDVAAAVRVLLAHDLEEIAEQDRLLGREIGGWTLEEPLGRGGSGRVYRSRRGGVCGALKLLDARHAGHDGRAGERLAVERAALERLSHPAIVRLLDAGTAIIDGEARDFLVTELIEDAETLFDGAVRDGLSSAGRLDLLAEIADAIGHAHAMGIVHRDLKPENVVLDQTGRPRILDFGIARLDRDPAVECDAFGSRATLAPEQVDSRIGPISPRTDVYALGVIGCRLLTGEWPYDVGDRTSTAIQATLHVPPFDLEAVDPPLPTGVRLALTDALSKSPAGRPADATALAARLRSPDASRPSRRAGRAIAIAAVSALALIVFARMRTPESSTDRTAPPPPTTGDRDMKKEVLPAIAGLMASASIASADVPTLNPIQIIEIPGAPTSFHVTMCGEDIVYLRMSDRAVRILRENPNGSWAEFGLPGQAPPSAGNAIMLFGDGSHLAVVEGSASSPNDRVDLYRRSSAGAWSFVQTVTAPTAGSFAYLTWGDWSGSTFIVGDRNADQYRGAAYVFEMDANGTWQQAAKLQGALATPSFTEVSRVAIEGNVAVLGHWLNPCGYSAPSGRIHVFRRNAGGSWNEEGPIRPGWAACGDHFANATYLAHGRALNLYGPTLSGFKQQFSHDGSQWQQLPDFVIPGADIDSALPARADFGLFLMSQPTGVAWALEKTANSFVPIARLAPVNRFSQSGLGIHIGAHGNRMATRLRLTSNTYGICLYDVTPVLDCDGDGIDNRDEITAGEPDCDGNLEPDTCQIATDPGLDQNGDGRLDGCDRARGDLDLSGAIDAADLSRLLSLWEAVHPSIGDLNLDGVVGAGDLTVLFANWGPIKP